MRRLALEDISFEMQPSQLTALVGPSGAGKTTITYLLPRLYDPTEGRITLDSHDLCDVNQESLAQQIGMVTQETYLFHDTVRANLLYARPDATQEGLEAACRAANGTPRSGKGERCSSRPARAAAARAPARPRAAAGTCCARVRLDGVRRQRTACRHRIVHPPPPGTARC